ncbi:ATP-binding domain-containing protein [Hymenobacter sp. BT507]|uniref:ATP-binding domain-containing protein n=1 Tax=Hymenobacter citatus TaxID=2763506 RepID=A0ABR7MQ36_9BACT|nr:3'-5' exonuclease [Hymenobacter citatus]MBC6613196.1 ATP-binding domain-containing protein [Hymenobacter citatus]
MANIEELEEYAEQTEDRQLQMLIQIVEDYGNEVVDLIKELKRLHVADGARDQAQLYFSTVHRCKGLEYDEVQLAPGFITQAMIDKLAEEFRAEAPEAGYRGKVLEEINLLYVALTRARKRVYVTADSLPMGFQPHADVQVMYGNSGTVLLEHLQTPTINAWDTPDAGPLPALHSLQKRLDASGR